MNLYIVKAAGQLLTVQACNYSTALNRAIKRLENENAINAQTQELEVKVTLQRRDIQRGKVGQ